MRSRSARLIIPITCLALGACSLTPPSRPPADDRAIQQAEAQLRETTDLRAALEQEANQAAAKIESLEQAIAELDAPFLAAKTQHAERQQAFEAYQSVLDQAITFSEQCDVSDPGLTAELGASMAASLATYQSGPERDTTVEKLDECRKKVVSAWRKLMKQNIRDLRKELAVEIEDTFDENNPYSRGGLTAKVSGATLNVRMKGNFEGRARHSQDQADMWCERASGLFTKVTLKNSHGTFTCKPAEKPEDLVQQILEDAEVVESWKVAGSKPIPQPPGPAPTVPSEVEEQRDAMLSEIYQLHAAAPEYPARAAELDEQQRQIDQTRKRLLAKDPMRVNQWKQTELKKASTTQTAGGVITGIGGALLLGTIGAWQGGVEGVEGFVPISVGISVPVIVTGVSLLVGGGVRKKRVNQVPLR